MGKDWAQKPLLISTMEARIGTGRMASISHTHSLHGLSGILWLPGRCLHPFPSSPFLKHGILSALARGPVTEAVWHAGFQPHHRRDWEPAFPPSLAGFLPGPCCRPVVGGLWSSCAPTSYSSYHLLFLSDHLRTKFQSLSFFPHH